MDDRQPWQMPPHEFARLPEASRVPRGSILALRPEDITRPTLDRYPTADLSALAQVVGVPHSGDRAALLDRILAAWKIRVSLTQSSGGILSTA